jgi:DNA mismatch endonuclease (patch repair protein)
MSRIRSRDTEPEWAVRSTLHKAGYRFRLHDPRLPGKPDLVFPSRRKVVFVHGCYWHGHSCRWGRAQSKSNRAFWVTKLKNNRARDARTVRVLRRDGWGILVIWQCQIKNTDWLVRTQRFLGEPRTRTGSGR